MPMPYFRHVHGCAGCAQSCTHRVHLCCMQGGAGEAGFEVTKYGDGRVALIGEWVRCWRRGRGAASNKGLVEAC